MLSSLSPRPSTNSSRRDALQAIEEKMLAPMHFRSHAPAIHFTRLLSALRLSACVATSVFLASSAHAASYELRIYSDDIPKQGESEIELIMSVAKPKMNSEGLNGRVAQTLIEYGYGLGNGWAIGLELPTSHVQGQHKVEGLKLEAQFVTEHSKDQGAYWGVRTDVGYTSTPYEPQGSNSMGINPIWGFRSAAWHFVVNPSIEIPLSGPSRQTLFQPSAKLARAFNSRRQLGIEYFSSWGAASSVLPQRQRDETLYLVWDEKLTTSRWNMGLGKPMNPSGGSVDKWVLKIGVNLDLD
jgi:hypothetical protein